MISGTLENRHMYSKDDRQSANAIGIPRKSITKNETIKINKSIFVTS